jgi:hypothetical protein
MCLKAVLKERVSPNDLVDEISNELLCLLFILMYQNMMSGTSSSNANIHG